MSRRFCIFVVALVAALLVVPAAFALRVHVRVEGKTHTIYGSAEPTLSVTSTALDALDSASVAGEFYYHVQIAASAATSTRSAATWPPARAAGSSR